MINVKQEVRKIPWPPVASYFYVKIQQGQVESGLNKPYRHL